MAQLLGSHMRNRNQQGAYCMHSPRYILTSLTASTMLAAALAARFVPDALSFAGDDLRKLLVANWVYVLVAGIALGVLNAYLTFARKPLNTE